VLREGADVGGPGDRLEAEIVIVGAGAAGIFAAMELARRGRDVLVLEAGGRPPDNTRDDFFAGVNAGQDYDLVWSRYRGLGGATNAWGGWCRPLDEYEMEVRPWMGGRSWPMSHGELMRYTKRAAALVDLGPWNWDAQRIAARHGRQSLADVPGAGDVLDSVVWRYVARPLSFADRYRAFLEGPASRIILNAPVTRIRVKSGAARSLEVTVAGGRRIKVRFAQLILAAGGIENVRLLLETQVRLRGEGQVVDASGWLGRGWQEHPHVPIGAAVIPESVLEGPLWLCAERRVVGGVPVMAGLSLPKRVLQERQLGAMSVTVNGEVPIHLARYANGIRYVAESVAGETTRVRQLFARAESRTVRQSRISLSGKRDALGRQQVRLNWRLADGDFRDLAVASEWIAEAFARLRLGVVHMDADRARLEHRMRGGAHHIGGARMSRSAQRGVTDGFGALHAIPNVYVSGSATFPSGGFSNPTLTILALALRQAEHIDARM